MRTYRSGWVPAMPSSVLDRVDDTDAWGAWLTVATFAPDGAGPDWLHLGPWKRPVTWEPVRADGGIRTWRAHDAAGTVATLELVVVRWRDGSQVSIELEAPLAAAVWAAGSINGSLRRLRHLVTEVPSAAPSPPVLRRAVQDEDHVSFA